ncbi:hypothetical protein [Hoeflea poritis]|uniref:Uncharacterized protein n=1 Tax=Hoeflea poritis TaxID=2993659 RepID=A0ABT4VMS8_9HYPH|nr:hypothetical protein [Hoeflea poritis]MDA4845986.1 hypothetical protein [Hoeflea poritis]
MPRYNEVTRRGYDLDLELPYYEVDGVKYRLGSAGSFILCCPKCGEQRFRDRITGRETCWRGHGNMVPVTFANKNDFPLPEGVTQTTVEHRRDQRLKREAANPYIYHFGDKAESDFPQGFIQPADAKTGDPS